MDPPRPIVSRHNPLLVRVRRLARGVGGYRRDGEAWIEGDHLCAAAAAARAPARLAVLTESALARDDRRQLAAHAERAVVVPDALFADLSPLGSPADIGFVIALPDRVSIDSSLDTVVLDRVQDAGNVGSILRSAAAMAVPQVLAIEGTAGLWSPKVLRAGMGAQFGLRLVEGLDESTVIALGLPLVATAPRAAAALHEADLPRPIAWLFGHEGQGASPSLLAGCRSTVSIPQPGGGESLNVAAAAAVCLYESMRRRL